MDLFVLATILFSAWWLWLNKNSLNQRRRSSARLPPGPYPYPIIGNIPHIGKFPHRTLTDLSHTYGPILSLRFGRVYTVVVSSSAIAKQMLQKHDMAFSGRTTTAASEVHDHHKFSMAQLPIGDDWRKLRKLSQEHLFSIRQLEASQGLRHEKLQKLRQYVQNCFNEGRAVNIGEAVFVTVLNLTSATVFSRELTDFDSTVTENFRSHFQGFTRYLGAPNVADFFPVLKAFDPQRIRKGAEFHTGKVLDLIEDIIDERLRLRKTSLDSPKKADFLETLLDSGQENGYGLSVIEIKHFLMDILIGGVDTTVSIIEWVMTELLLNPDILSKVKQELKTVIEDNKQVQESDFSQLPYFRAVVKEVFRYHPPGPLLLPRKSEQDIEINGYTIPKGTKVLFNYWALSRDPNQWSNPDSFKPERFLDNKINFKGQDFEFIPFGAGRRICPGLALADRMLNMTVMTLIHNFDWKLMSSSKLGEEDHTAEKFELSLRKAVPLVATPIGIHGEA